MRERVNRKLRVFIALATVVAAVMLSLPFIVSLYVKHTLKDLSGHRAVISGVGLDLFRAAYYIDSLRIYKTTTKERLPLLYVRRVHFSLEWKALMHGQLVGQIRFENPEVNFIAGKGYQKNRITQSGCEVDWTQPLKKLTLLPINRITVQNGVLVFHDFSTDPATKLFLNNISVESKNLHHTNDDSDLLPSRIFAQANSTGNGNLSLVMKVNVRKTIPDLDLDLRLEDASLRSLTGLHQVYGTLPAATHFSLFSEITVIDGKVTGYVNPQLRNVAAAPTGTVSHDIRPKPHVTSHIALKARIPGGDVQFLPMLWNIFRNASLEGLARNSAEAEGLALWSAQQPDYSIRDVSADENDRGSDRTVLAQR